MATHQSTSHKSTKDSSKNEASSGRKWTPAQHKKFRKTMRLRRENGDSIGDGIIPKRVAAKKKSNGASTGIDRDIVVTLMDAEQTAFDALKAGKIKRFSRDQLLSMLALNSVLES